MELWQLSTFVKVVSVKNFSRAARELKRTQPAVSMAVQKLESELGEKLLDRNGKDGTLTDAGQLVYSYACRIDTLCQEMVSALSELRDNHTGKISIGANDYGSLYLSNPVSLFRRHYPHVKVEVQRSSAQDIPAKL